VDLYPGLKHYGQADFVAVGAGGAWCMGIMGRLVLWEGVQATIIKKAVDCWKNKARIMNIELSPVAQDIYFIEAKDGSVAYHVPDDWHAKMRLHLRPEHMLEHSRPERPQANSIPRVRRSNAPRALFGSLLNVRNDGAPAPPARNVIIPTAAPTPPRPLIQPFVDLLPRYEEEAPQGYDQDTASRLDPPEYTAAAMEEMLPITAFANGVHTSGVVQTVPVSQDGGNRTRGAEWEFVEMVIATSPTTIRSAPHLLNVEEMDNGCVVM